MTTQLLLAYGLGAAALLAAALILIPIETAHLRKSGARMALAALMLTVPVVALVALSAGSRETEDLPVGIGMVAPTEMVATDANGMKQDADWELIAHVNLGGPPPGAGATGDPGAAAARAQRSAAELAAVTRNEPRNVEAWLALGQAHRTARDYAAAIAAYSAALKLDATNADAWADYADALASANNRKLAGQPATAVARALKVNPNHLKGLWLQASLDLEQGRHNEALKNWQKLRATLAPSSPDVAVIDANIAEAKQLAAQATGGG